MIYRRLYFTAWHSGSMIVNNFRFLGISSGAWNTGVLLTSSLTVAIAVRAAKIGQRRVLLWMLAGTWVLGATFLGIKAAEYTHEYFEGVMPGISLFHPDSEISADLATAAKGPKARAGFDCQFRLFWVFYFFMTGVHAISHDRRPGVCLLFCLSRRIAADLRRKNICRSKSWVCIAHFVDLVWIFLFPLFYLVR